MSRRLPVPHVLQPSDSYECQVACAAMVCAFYEGAIEYDRILDDFAPWRLGEGTHAQGTALFFLQRGYQVQFAHHDFGVLTPDLEKLTELDHAKIAHALESIPVGERFQYRRTKLELDRDVIAAGGKYSTKLPELEEVRRYIDGGCPVILSGLRARGLYLDPTMDQSNHAVVVTGCDEWGFFINDPAASRGGTYHIERLRLLHAWYNSGAYMIAVGGPHSTGGQ